MRFAIVERGRYCGVCGSGIWPKGSYKRNGYGDVAEGEASGVRTMEVDGKVRARRKRQELHPCDFVTCVCSWALRLPYLEKHQNPRRVQSHCRVILSFS